jgi:hypothetical protein
VQVGARVGRSACSSPCVSTSAHTAGRCGLGYGVLPRTTCYRVCSAAHQGPTEGTQASGEGGEEILLLLVVKEAAEAFPGCCSELGPSAGSAACPCIRSGAGCAAGGTLQPGICPGIAAAAGH